MSWAATLRIPAASRKCTQRQDHLEHLDGRRVLVMVLGDHEGLDESVARGPLPTVS
jgi:hypothetical protein